MSKENGVIKAERYNGTLIVYVPAVKWYQLGVPYHSELERVLRPAAQDEEHAIVVAPDKTTFKYLKLESYPAHIPIVLEEREAHRLADLAKYSSRPALGSRNGNGNGYHGNGSGNGDYSNGSALNGKSPDGHWQNGDYDAGTSSEPGNNLPPPIDLEKLK